MQLPNGSLPAPEQAILLPLNPASPPAPPRPARSPAHPPAAVHGLLRVLRLEDPAVWAERAHRQVILQDEGQAVIGRAAHPRAELIMGCGRPSLTPVPMPDMLAAATGVCASDQDSDGCSKPGLGVSRSVIERKWLQGKLWTGREQKQGPVLGLPATPLGRSVSLPYSFLDYVHSLEASLGAERHIFGEEVS